MVSHNHQLTWTSAECELVWMSEKTYQKTEDIYIKLWGLIQTINTTNAQYQEQLNNCKSARKRPIIEKHFHTKKQYYPTDNFPLIAFHPTNVSYHHITLKKNQAFSLTIAFGGQYQYLAQQWLNWFDKRLTLENTGFVLANTPILQNHCRQLPKISINNIQYAKQLLSNNTELTILIDTPANLQSQTKQKETLEKSQHDTIHYNLIENTKKRLCQWFPEQNSYIENWFNQYHDLLFNSPIYTHQLYLQHKIKTLSKSSQNKTDEPKIQFHNGMKGWLTLKGIWAQLDALWDILYSIHMLGQRTQINGLGYILPANRAKHPPLTLWQRYITKPAHVRYAIDTIINQQNYKPELDAKGKIITEDTLYEQIQKKLKHYDYQPQPNQATLITNPDGSINCLEQMTQQDMIIHQIVCNTITPIIDNHLCCHSLGYRKDYDRKIACDKIHQLINDGYNWVIETNIEELFSSIKFDILWQQLDDILPRHEFKLIELIKKLVQAPYFINKTGIRRKLKDTPTAGLHQRTQGLMQNSPLTPILANLYLSQLDQQIIHQNLAFIRYADDILLFCRHQKDTTNTLAWLTEQLQKIGLELVFNETAIIPIEAGFEFLGYRFDKDDANEQSIVPILQQRKPIMITGTSKYLALNNNALEVKESRPSKPKSKTQTSKQLVQVIPLRRISQLIIIGNHSLSSPLLSACAKEQISVHFVNQYGFQVGTMTPINAEFLSINAKQYYRHQHLKPSQILAIAIDIVKAKINNYQTWIKNSYRKGDALLIKQLNHISEQANTSTDLNKLRGYEGQAAKLCFKRLQNCMIEEQRPTFTSQRRSRGGTDRLNSLLNFGYYWLFTRLSALIRSHGLNPYLSFLHNSEQNYETLTYDLMEIFRVQIDKTALRLINRKQLQDRDFHLHPKKGWQLNPDALRLYSNQLQATFTSKINNTYLEDIIFIQIRTIQQWAISGKSLLWFYWYVEKNNVQFNITETDLQTPITNQLTNETQQKNNSKDYINDTDL